MPKEAQVPLRQVNHRDDSDDQPFEPQMHVVGVEEVPGKARPTGATPDDLSHPHATIGIINRPEPGSHALHQAACKIEVRLLVKV